MDNPDIEAKKSLEASKLRLASAFKRLDKAIEALHSAQTSEELKEEIMRLEQEKAQMQQDLQSVTFNYSNLRQISTDIFAQLNSTIYQIERLLHSQHANS